ncbi:uncharacterized protein J5F26_015162 [Ciconia maguari]
MAGLGMVTPRAKRPRRESSGDPGVSATTAGARQRAKSRQRERERREHCPLRGWDPWERVPCPSLAPVTPRKGRLAKLCLKGERWWPPSAAPCPGERGERVPRGVTPAWGRGGCAGLCRQDPSVPQSLRAPRCSPAIRVPTSRGSPWTSARTPLPPACEYAGGGPRSPPALLHRRPPAFLRPGWSLRSRCLAGMVPGRPAARRTAPSSWSWRGPWSAPPCLPAGGGALRPPSPRSSRETPTRWVPVYVKLRPHVQQFLESLSKTYEIFIFTTAKQDYTDKVLDVLDPKKKLIRHCLSQRDCLCARGCYWKDLTRLGRDLAKTVALDHTIQGFPAQVPAALALTERAIRVSQPGSTTAATAPPWPALAFSPQAANWIPVPRWWGDPRDEELLRLTPLLGQLGRAVRTRGLRGDTGPLGSWGRDDVRTEIRQRFPHHGLPAED